jgi:AraC family transcriptional activator of tynA and feaB
VKIWNTEELPDSEQFAYWREVLCEAFVRLRPERPREHGSSPFASRVTACIGAGNRLSSVSAAPRLARGGRLHLWRS